MNVLLTGGSGFIGGASACQQMETSPLPDQPGRGAAPSYACSILPTCQDCQIR